MQFHLEKFAKSPVQKVGERRTQASIDKISGHTLQKNSRWLRKLRTLVIATCFDWAGNLEVEQAWETFEKRLSVCIFLIIAALAAASGRIINLLQSKS